ncbi:MULTISPECIES: IS66 family insertion sequence element accessory protein TnpB [unclassified Bradyrhizobium]|uniref:IS66 family insertion sequence element accessory protein TnpB n=1 Tax=unclassified Bradyrhizobium TaxID=2631580 RepID=UPI003395E139
MQGHSKKDPFSGHLFVFRGTNASLLKILFWDGTGCACSPSASVTGLFRQSGALIVFWRG